jgi:hypothetical protein
LKGQIGNLRCEVDAHIIEESEISDSLVKLNEEKGKEE